MKKIVQILFHRVTLVALFMLIQLAILIFAVWRFNNNFVIFYAINILIGALIVVEIINNRSNPAYKIAWIIPVLLLPIFGGMLYLVFGRGSMSQAEIDRLQGIRDDVWESQEHALVLEDIVAKSAAAATQSRYIVDNAYSPPFENTWSEYLPQGEASFERMKKELEKAKKYIFMEYFIVQPGVMWDDILEILIRKVKQGVDVRLIYDDMGCMFTLPYRYDRLLGELGIQCCVFNPFRPVLSSRFNNRSHRKVAVVDGHTAFTGGINLADEYINVYEKHGHWKDTTILVKGEAAWGLTTMFLSMWSYVSGVVEEHEHFHPGVYPVLPGPATGYVQPFADSPMDDEAVSENIYMNLIYKAERYAYITTPYLIVGNEMVTALCTAAKSGIDVRIITPHIADKWYVHAVTRHNYTQLIESGVKIYEYTPGFIHAKSFVVDDTYGVVSTVNLDFRSLFLHFECGVWLYETESIGQIYRDFQSTMKLSQLVTLEQCNAVPFYRRMGRAILSVFAPLM